MKKSLPIILLSVFTLAFSAVGFLGIQPVKATTEVAGITIEDGAVGYEGVSITHADQATNEDGDAVSSGEGKMKFYSSLTQDLYNSLQGKDFKTGTLIIPAELLQGESVADKLNTLDITKVGVNGAINVDTTNVWTLYDVDDDKEENDVDDAYWAMASLYNIPRAYYGVPMAARSYLAVKGEGDADYTYVYSATNDVTDFYSLTTTALKKLEAGDYDEKEDLKTAITNDYTTFKVTFHFDEMNKDVVNYLGYEWQPTKTFTVKYGGVLPKADDVYNGTFFMNYLDTQYKYLKGFYNKNRSAFAVMLGLAMNANDVSSEVGGSATPEETYMPENDAFMTRVYGDMHLYEEVAPANLLDDFSTAQSVTAAYSYEVYPTNSKRNYKKILQNEGAAWYAEKTDVNGVTEEGVLAIPSQFASASSANSTTGQYAVTTNTHLFHFTSSIRNHTFWSNSYYKSTNIADVTADDYYTGSNKSDYDYVNFRILVDTSLADVETVNLHGLYGAAYGNYANQNPTAVPVGEWINIKMLRGHIESIMNASSYGAYREQNVTSNSPFVITAANNAQKVEGAFTLYVDYMAYERDMRISVNGEDGYYVIENTNAHNGRYPYLPMYEKVTSVVGQEVTLGTALTNGTIVYNVTDPDGENVT
ncbi:MAG: hypothetical protein IJW26_00545, partial [Clostridia bacterium]|nr:hypothetical protein [Clostridia bacterium]